MSVFKAFQPIIFTFFLFPLYRCGGLGGHIVEHTVDTGDLIYDAHGDAVKHVIGQAVIKSEVLTARRAIA